MKLILKSIFYITLTLIISSTVVYSQAIVTSNDSNHSLQTNTRFKVLKTALFAQPYKELPQYKVKRRLFGTTGSSDKNKLLSAARRTFSSSEDFFEEPDGQKLLNANGVCFSGWWKITNDNPYTGLYKKGASSPAIVRASVAFSGTKQKNKRAFGMAIKLLPSDLGNAPSLNAFVLHSMGGTVTKNVLNLSMDNQPPLGSLPRLRDISIALRLQRDLERADKEVSNLKPDATYRPVSSFANHQAEYGVVKAPRWLRLSPITSQRVNKKDFRDELRTQHYPGQQIQYAIEVAGDSSSLAKDKKNSPWFNIGLLELTESVTSLSCDLNLHFQHPAQ